MTSAPSANPGSNPSTESQPMTDPFGVSRRSMRNVIGCVTLATAIGCGPKIQSNEDGMGSEGFGSGSGDLSNCPPDLAYPSWVNGTWECNPQPLDGPFEEDPGLFISQSIGCSFLYEEPGLWTYISGPSDEYCRIGRFEDVPVSSLEFSNPVTFGEEIPQEGWTISVAVSDPDCTDEQWGMELLSQQGGANIIADDQETVSTQNGSTLSVQFEDPEGILASGTHLLKFETDCSPVVWTNGGFSGEGQPPSLNISLDGEEITTPNGLQLVGYSLVQ